MHQNNSAYFNNNLLNISYCIDTIFILYSDNYFNFNLLTVADCNLNPAKHLFSYSRLMLKMEFFQAGRENIPPPQVEHSLMLGFGVGFLANPPLIHDF